MKNLTSGAEFHKFETAPVFIGKYVEPALREKDAPDAGDDESKKAGSVLGYRFEDLDGEQHLIGASAGITKAIEKTKPGAWLRVEFKGKTKNAKGQPVNRFQVDEFENENEVREYLEGEEKE